MKLVKIQRNGASAEGVLVGEDVRIIGGWRPGNADANPFTLSKKPLTELRDLLAAAGESFPLS